MQKNNNLIKFVIKVVISISIFYYLLNQVDLNKIISIFINFKIIDFIIPVIFYIFAHIINALRLKCLMPERSFLHLIRFTFIALFYGTILPGQILGDAVKAYNLIRVGDDRANIVSTVLLDKIIGLFALTILMCIGLLFMPENLNNIFLYFSIVLLFLLILVILFSDIIYLIIKKLLNIFKIDMKYIYRPSFSSKYLFFSVIMGLCFQFISALIIKELGLVVGIELSLLCWFTITGILSFILLVPISWAGIGLREGTLISLLGLVGVPATDAFILSILLLCLTLFGALVGCLISILSYEH